MTTAQMTKKIQHLENELAKLRYTVIRLLPEGEKQLLSEGRQEAVISPARATVWLKSVKKVRADSERRWKAVRGLWKNTIKENPLQYQRRVRAEE